MTIKEIAKLCKVTQQTVLNWVHRTEFLNQKIWLRNDGQDEIDGDLPEAGEFLNQKISVRNDGQDEVDRNLPAIKAPITEKISVVNAIQDKLNSGSPEHPADFTLDETIAIIQAGGNETLVSLLMDNAYYKHVTETVRPEGYGVFIKSASNAAKKIFKLMQKYRYSDKVTRADANMLLQHAATMRRYFGDSAMVTDSLVIAYHALKEKMASLERHFGITDETANEMVLDMRGKMTYKAWAALGDTVGRETLRDTAERTALSGMVGQEVLPAPVL